MKRGTNPLYPASDGKGVKGTYEMAALMDDSDKIFNKKTPKQADLDFIQDTGESYREFSKDHREIMGDYRQKLKKLKRQKKTGEISTDEFHELKKDLIKKTDAKNRASFKAFLLGK